MTLALVMHGGCGAGSAAEGRPQVIGDSGAVVESEFWFGQTLTVRVSDEEAEEIERAGATVLEAPHGWDLRIAWTA